MKTFDIQLFAEEIENPGTDPKHTENQDKGKEPDRDERSVAKYTDEDVDKLINKKFAEWQKQQDKKVSEAERLSKMTAEEKAAERMKALEEKLHGYEVAAARAEMMKQGRAMLHEKNINVNDELLTNLISDNAENTKSSVENFITLFNTAVEKAVKEALKGDSPKGGSAPAGMTKEQILAIPNRAERQRLMKEHKELF
jgi:hypothetical protein